MKKHSPHFGPMARRIALLSISAGILVACGGGGGSADIDDTPARPTRFWTMDSITYSESVTTQQTSLVGGRPFTVVIVNSKTTEGGSEAYSGGALIFQTSGTGPGIYNVVPDVNALVANNAPVNAIVVISDIGTGVATGTSSYYATGGQVEVSIDSAGKASFSTVAPLAVTKRIEVNGGVAGSPEVMALTIKDPS